MDQKRRLWRGRLYSISDGLDENVLSIEALDFCTEPIAGIVASDGIGGGRLGLIDEMRGHLFNATVLGGTDCIGGGLLESVAA